MMGVPRWLPDGKADGAARSAGEVPSFYRIAGAKKKQAARKAPAA